MAGWSPGRYQHAPDNLINPLFSGNPLQHPGDNPSGLYPGMPPVPFGALAWTDYQTQRFRSNGTNQVWTWESPVFDLRPGMSVGYGQIPAAIAINHEGAYGQGVYLNLVVGESVGGVPPATRSNMTAFYWSDGNTITVTDQASLQNLTQVIEVTDQLQAGGTNTAVTNPNGPFGASVFSFSPPVSGLRFWKLTFQLIVDGVGAVTEPYFIQASVH